MHRTTKKDRRKRAAREAADWLQVMADQPNAADNEALMEWAQSSPVHLRELLLARMVEGELSGDVLEGFDVDAVVARARADDNVVPLDAEKTRQQPAQTAPRSRRRRRKWLQVAMAGMLVVLAGVGGWGAWQSLDQGVAYATTLGEQRVLELDDGSVVTLSPSSRIQVELSPHTRDIWLRSGEADFQVAHDKSRPFRVHAGTSVVQAVGTRFTVNSLPSGTVVTVSEGVVRLESGHREALDSGLMAWLHSWQPTDVDAIKRPGTTLLPLDQPRSLSAGQSAHIARNGRELALTRETPVVSTDVARKLIMFHDDTLADIAAAFNRYNAVQMVVKGDEARLQRFSGVFDTDDAASFLDFLRCWSRLNVRRQGEVVVVHNEPAVARARR